MRPPRVRTHSFPPSIRRIYTSGPCSCRASSCFADLPTFVCLMRFLFVGSVVCRRLPSAHVSRRRPCLWLCAWRYLLHSGLAPIRTRSCRAHKKSRQLLWTVGTRSNQRKFRLSGTRKQPRRTVQIYLAAFFALKTLMALAISPGSVINMGSIISLASSSVMSPISTTAFATVTPCCSQ